MSCTLKSCLPLFVALLFAAPAAMAQAPEDDNPGRGGRFGEGGGPNDSPSGGRGRFGGFRGGPGGPGGNPMFDAIDADGDGQITSPELKKAAAALRKLDADNDGILTRDETRPRGGPGGDPQQFLDRMFTDNDADGDGALTADEVPERMAPMLQGADEDGDGRVTKKEMSTAMENFRNRFRGGPGGGQGGPGGFSGGPGGDPSQMAGGMIGRYDRDGDGKLSPQEVPQQMMGMLRGGDMNQDGLIDAREMAAIAEQAGGRFRGGYGQGGPDGGGRSRQFPGRGDNGRPGGGEQPQQ